MISTKELQDEILKLKKENDISILAHSYQTHDITEVADFVGDSYALSNKATTLNNKTILMCGVRFMAETAKILSPEKKVILSNGDAGCPMAEQLSVDELKKLKKKYKKAAVVAYINTTAELKEECDVCVTSSSALDVVKRLPNKEILFIPDCNLGSWLAEQISDKKFHFIKGGCPVHMKITLKDVKEAREKHPLAKLLIHPECVSEVTREADYAGSTTEIIKYVENSNSNEFIIGTDNSIVEHLKFMYPKKSFYPLSKECICKDMRLTTLMDVYNCVKGTGGEEIVLSDETIKKAKNSIDAMLS